MNNVLLRVDRHLMFAAMCFCFAGLPMMVIYLPVGVALIALSMACDWAWLHNARVLDQRKAARSSERL
jgi:hypothetical protein